MSKGRYNSKTDSEREISARGIVPASGYQAKISGGDDIATEVKTTTNETFFVVKTGDTANTKRYNKFAERGGIAIAYYIVGEDEGGISRRFIVTKGQLYIEE